MITACVPLSAIYPRHVRAASRSLAALAVLASATGAARADDPVKARAVAERGVAAAGEGRRTGNAAKFTEAVALFKEAFALHPDPEYQCSIGIAYRDLKDPARAHLYLGRCIARTTAADRKEALAKVQAKLEADLRASHVPVDIVVDPPGAQVTVSAWVDDPFAAPWLVWLPPGAHSIDATASGYQPGNQQIEIKSGVGRQTVSIALTREVVAPIDPPPDQPPPDKDPPGDGGAGAMQPPEPPRDDGKPPSRLVGKLVIGGGVLLLAGGGVFHALAVGNIGELDELNGDPRRPAKVSTIEKQRAAAIGLYAAGAATVGIGLWLTFRKPKRDSAITIAPLAEGGAMLVWSTER